MIRHLVNLLRLLIILLAFIQSPLSASNVTLCYHQFSYSLTNLYSVLPEVFDWQMKYIQDRHIKVTSMRQMLERYKSHSQIGTNVLLTADDGWKSVMNIVPILQKYDFPMTFNLVSSVLNRNSGNLNAKDIQALLKTPQAEFGCHSYSHLLLMHRSNSILTREIILSRKNLEKILAQPVPTFAYPYGYSEQPSRKMASENFDLSFGVNPEPNPDFSDRDNLSRDIIYKTTTFGEFINIIETIDPSPIPNNHDVLNLGFGKGHQGSFDFVKVKLFRYPPHKMKKTVLIVPSTDIGPGWCTALIRNLNSTGIQVMVAVPRNNNIPSYRPDRELRSITNWGLNAYMSDLASVLATISKESKEIVIITWGDGFDIVAATLSRTNKRFVRGMIALDPSVHPSDENRFDFKSSTKSLTQRIIKGEYALSRLAFFLKVKTLADLAIILPDAKSPYGSYLNHPDASNMQMLEMFIHDAGRRDLSLEARGDHYTTDDFKKAFMSPLPAFSMLVPTALRRDIHQLWAHGFQSAILNISLERNSMKIPVYWAYNSHYTRNVDRLKTTFTNMQFSGESKYHGLSTAELLLSSIIAKEMTDRTREMFSKK